MSRRLRALTETDVRGGRWIQVATAAAAVMLGAAALAIAWRPGSNGASTGQARPPAPTAEPTVPTPHTVAGVPEGFPDTADGARAAAMAFIGVEAGDLMARPDAYLAAWEEMCTPTYYASEGRAKAQVVLTEQEATNHLASNASAGQRVYERAFPLTAVVVTGGKDAATVRTWSLDVQHPGDGPTAVSFGAGVMDLRWSGTDWKLDGGNGLPSLDDGTSAPLQLSPGPGLPTYLSDEGGA